MPWEATARSRQKPATASMLAAKPVLVYFSLSTNRCLSVRASPDALTAAHSGQHMDAMIAKTLAGLKTSKKLISLFILILMALVVLISSVELAIIIWQEVFDSLDGMMFLDIEELFRLFGFVFMILIGLELIETVEMYFKENVVHAEIVVLIAVIAVSRKVILLDLEKYDPITVIGLGLILLALGGCYFLMKKANLVTQKA